MACYSLVTCFVFEVKSLSHLCISMHFMLTQRELTVISHSYKSRKVHELWWYGLPPGIRGRVWQKAIGNDLNISPGEPYQSLIQSYYQSERLSSAIVPVHSAWRFLLLIVL